MNRPAPAPARPAPARPAPTAPATGITNTFVLGHTGRTNVDKLDWYEDYFGATAHEFIRGALQVQWDDGWLGPDGKLPLNYPYYTVGPDALAIKSAADPHKVPYHDTFVWIETGPLSASGNPSPPAPSGWVGPTGWLTGWAAPSPAWVWVPRTTWLPTTETPDAQRFRAALQVMLAEITDSNAMPPDRILSELVDLTGVLDLVQSQLDPVVTIEQATAQRLDFGAAGVTRPDRSDALDPIMVSPEFDFPMYEALSDLSTDWLFSGADQTPPNSISLLEGNQKFIEAFMVGLSYEMGRMLLFNEYPTDQRATYFRHFWDSSAADSPAVDIQPIHTWRSLLGQNSTSTAALLLLLRGDLLHRYPGTVIYAVKATWDSVAAQPKFDDASTAETISPSFHATLKPDATFLGFALDEATAVSATPASPGYFFVIQQQHTAPHFGLEPYTSSKGTGTSVDRDGIEWGNFLAGGADPATLGYLDVEQPRPSVTVPDSKTGASVPPPADVHWPGNVRSSDVAWLTWRRPYRIAIHASKLLSATP